MKYLLSKIFNFFIVMYKLKNLKIPASFGSLKVFMNAEYFAFAMLFSIIVIIG